MINASSSSNDNNIMTFLDETGLLDLMHDYLPDQQPSTYQCSCSKVDYIWSTLGVLTTTINAGILPFGTGPNLDHAILYIYLLYETLTGISSQSALYDPTHPGVRNLWSTDIKAAAKYKTMVKQGFHAKNIHERIAILVSHCNQTRKCMLDDECILNKIEKAITGILLHAEVECKKAQGYSPLYSQMLAIQLLPLNHTYLRSSTTGYKFKLWTRHKQLYKQRNN